MLLSPEGRLRFVAADINAIRHRSAPQFAIPMWVAAITLLYLGYESLYVTYLDTGIGIYNGLLPAF
jgi:hypothetical protein